MLGTNLLTWLFVFLQNNIMMCLNIELAYGQLFILDCKNPSFKKKELCDNLNTLYHC